MNKQMIVEKLALHYTNKEFSKKPKTKLEAKEKNLTYTEYYNEFRKRDMDNLTYLMKVKCV